MPHITLKTRFLRSKRNVYSMVSCVLLAACVLSVTSPAHAIVTANSTISETSPLLESSGDWDINWDYVYKYKGCSAVAISPYWLLTANHVADDNVSGVITVNGTLYTPVYTVLHKDTLSQDPIHSGDDYGADLALIRLDKPLPGYYDLYEGTAKGNDAVLIGYGYAAGSVTSTSYSWSTSTSRIKRWGTNRVDSNTSATFIDSKLHAVSDVFRMGFRLTDTPYEAGVATWDSGGGAFVKDTTDDTWKLAGINVYVHPSTTENFYAAMDAVRLENYLGWVDNILANPAYFYYPSILGDANEDGAVDVIDLGILATYYGKEGGAIWGEGDFNFDGNVDVIDLGILSTYYGSTSSTSLGDITPEPTSISLLALGSFALIRKRNHIKQ